MWDNYKRVGHALSGASPALLLAVPCALLTYAVWRRARYFGNTSSLLVAALCVALGLAAPHYPGQGFLLVAAPFLFAFVAGVFADLLETPSAAVVRAGLAGLLGANALWNLIALARL
jgi:NO-binding membrane sensor protein with MHYT domain